MLHDQFYIWEDGAYTPLASASDTLHSWKAAWAAALPDSVEVEPKLHLPGYSLPPHPQPLPDSSESTLAPSQFIPVPPQ